MIVGVQIHLGCRRNATRADDGSSKQLDIRFRRNILRFHGVIDLEWLFIGYFSVLLSIIVFALGRCIRCRWRG